MNYTDFFQKVTGFAPYPYQQRLGAQAFPEMLDVPTGLGKTAAVSVAWMYKRLQQPAQTPTRLVYCLPMRSLVTQTHQAIAGWLDTVGREFAPEAEAPSVHLLMGGDQDVEWAAHPERPAVIVGTQDMLLSRALMRGYGMSRFEWPVHYGLLHNDAMWVFDETQLMGVTVETSAQLEAFRQLLGAAGNSRSLWMSATLGDGQLDTVDHPKPEAGWITVTLDDADLDHRRVHQRLSAAKDLERCDVIVPKSTSKKNQAKYASDLADAVLDAHIDDTLTLVIVNRVNRAQNIYEALVDAGRDPSSTSLLHSRYRPIDRSANEAILHAPGDRIVVATQAVEAGVDVSARTMFTELAPWSSLVQRFGRCNRSGEYDEAQVFWLDVEFDKDGDDSLLPYELADMQRARELLASLGDVGPGALAKIDYEPPPVIRPVLRRKDLLELFDTTPDLAGADMDVSRYIRDGEDNDALVYWRRWEGNRPGEEIAKAERDELCRVSMAALSKFVGKKSVTGWSWDALDGQWRQIDRVRPGMTVLFAAAAGGYDERLGWTGQKAPKNQPVPLADDHSAADDEGAGNSDDRDDAMDADARSNIGQWVRLDDHLNHVAGAVEDLCDRLGLDDAARRVLVRAARWHDVGKAHPVFQARLVEPAVEADDLQDPPGDGPWAKSNHRRGRYARRHFRHELASALAFRQFAGAEDPDRDLTAYLIAAHHGKVRLSIRSLPGEDEPTDASADGLFARGVWHGDILKALEVPGETAVGDVTLDLRCMRLGSDNWLERTLALRDDSEMGPFRLAWLEAVLRLADRRASAAESRLQTNALTEEA
ncbi:MAG: CRISPR-associated endonuclease Cas3'' [Persicimonas sp.]